MPRRKKKISAINSTSSADIAFLLLIFFLVTSSLDSKTGIYRKLNPAAAENILKKKSEIKDRNLLELELTADNRYLFEEEAITLEEIHDIGKTFVANPNNMDYLPEKIDTEIPEIGKLAITSNHVIAIKINREAQYEAYIALLNELTGIYNELRDETSLRYFKKSFTELTEEQRTAIRTVFPLRISEKEEP